MEAQELARLLCVQVGMIMEDACLGAISTGIDPPEQVAALKLATDKMGALITAAAALISE
jgi:hypothetical protein